MNLLVHQAALGDWVLTFPILRHLTQGSEFQGQPLAIAAPYSKTRLACRLMPGMQCFDIETPDWSRLFADLSPGADIERTSAANLLRQIRLIISFVTDGNDAWARNVRMLAPQAQLVPILPRPPRNWTNHVTAWHRYQAKSHGLELRDWKIPISPNPHGTIVIHPGSGGRNKCWPIPFWEKIISRLQAQNHPVTTILGEVEMATWSQTRINHWLNHLNARQVLSLDDLYERLRSARLYIGNDSGPTHLAAQMSLPTIALFGPTDPCIWRPLGPDVTILAPQQPQPMTWLSDDQLLTAIGQKLDSAA